MMGANYRQAEVLARPKRAKKPGKASSKEQSLPIPKGDSAYARGKRAEYIEKDLEKAKELYLEAIQTGEKAESAVKDIASILHQQHRTQEALAFLLDHKRVFSNFQKFQNMYNTFERQQTPRGNCLNRILKLSPLSPNAQPSDVQQLFSNPSRIQDLAIHDGFALLYFHSHSAARKTLEGFFKWDAFKVEWVSLNGVVQGEAGYGYTMHKKYEVEEELPVLARDPSENTAVLLLGKSLYEEI